MNSSTAPSAGIQPTTLAPAKAVHVCICICTFKRAELLRRLLEGVKKLQNNGGAFTYSVVVVDNDEAGSARAVIENFRSQYGESLAYGIEPQRNFALVRNKTVSLAHGDFIAFVDDDEIPVPEWLVQLLKVQKEQNADGVLGPVRPYFDNPPQSWVIKGKLCDRPVHPTGMTMNWNQTRTGNVLVRLSLFREAGLMFDPAFATGGEDVDFFKRAIGRGFRFVWCEEAPAYELVPPERLKKSYFLRRALLQGRVSLKYATKKPSFSAKVKVGLHSSVAIVVYTLALPIVAIGGFHLVMKYLIKLCHHFSRFCALMGIQLMQQRNF